MHTQLGKAAEIPAATLAVAQQTFAGEQCFTPAITKSATDESVLVTDSEEFADFFRETFWSN